MLDIQIKDFNSLSTLELYTLLQLRSEVFVVEQNCVYQDIDDKDTEALHVLGYKGDNLVAYARCFKPGEYFTEASIGRVVVAKTHRGFAYGEAIIKASIQAIQTHYNSNSIKISAQTYLLQFYNNLGFTEVGKTYLEDGIPHIAMLITIKNK